MESGEPFQGCGHKVVLCRLKNVLGSNVHHCISVARRLVNGSRWPRDSATAKLRERTLANVFAGL